MSKAFQFPGEAREEVNISSGSSGADLETRNVHHDRSNVFLTGFPFSLLADIRLQLNEQLRCLDVRMEAQVALVAELQDFFRKRAELELDYSKSLDKMARSIQLRHKEQKQKYVTL